MAQICTTLIIVSQGESRCRARDPPTAVVQSALNEDWFSGLEADFICWVRSLLLILGDFETS